MSDGTGRLYLRVSRSDTGETVISNVEITVNTTDNEFFFPLSGFAPSKILVKLNLSAVHNNGKVFTAVTKLRRLPNSRTVQSLSRIDHLYGGMLVKTTASPWTLVFPFSFYLAGQTLDQDRQYLVKFRRHGFNILHLIPGGGLGYNLTELDTLLDDAERAGLWIMFDMRWSYQTEDWVTLLVNRIKDRKNLLLWYTSDEPGE